MTNINCSSNCVHQKDGICTLNDISKKKTATGAVSNCGYFEAKTEGF